MDILQEEPCLVQTGKGSSVFYSGVYLYSKYDPQRAILSQIETLQVLPNTLILVTEPVLDYCFEILLNKLNKGSFVLCLHCDKTLYDFSLKHSPLLASKEKALLSFYAENVNTFTKCFLTLEAKYDFKRIIVIAGTALAKSNEAHKLFFEKCIQTVESYLKQKVVNTLTLINLGHVYASNFFKNLFFLSKPSTTKEKKHCTTIDTIKVSKPILILGGGPSLDQCVNFIKKHNQSFFVLALDAVASKVSKHLHIDGIVLLEAQSFILPSLVGSLQQTESLLFTDLTSQASIIKQGYHTNVLYYTRYTESTYLQRFESLNLFTTPFQSLGSVGLTAIQIALNIRESEKVPIFVTGLDFAYTTPFTHSKYSFQVSRIFSKAQKLTPHFLPEQFFSKDILKKDHPTQKVFTTKALLTYDQNFLHLLSSEKNIFSLPSFSHSSIDFDCVLSVIQTNGFRKNTKPLPIKEKSPFCTGEVLSFLQNIKTELLTIKDAITSKTQLSEAQLFALLQKNDFLYLHFADYSKVNKEKLLETSFLKRIRIELEYFLKCLKHIQ